MPLICYQPKDFSSDKLDLIARANSIIREYQGQGFNLTLRQLYYQFVARDFLPASWADKRGILNRPESYNKLGDLVSDARLAGLIDWYAIVDRSRASSANQHWQRPSQVIEAALASYAIDKWSNQPHYVEVWVEKEALEDVLARACRPLDVRFFACKGYTSQSAMWEASQRLVRKIEDGKQVHIVHLGDHDPSGIDMTRDIFERLSMFTYSRVDIQRIALNISQVQEYNPPPNPAKTTDSRYKAYQEEFGEESWELDALEPSALVRLINDKVLSYRDESLWAEATKNEERGRNTIECILKYFPDVVGFLRERRKRDDSPVVCQGCGATQANPRCLCSNQSSTILL